MNTAFLLMAQYDAKVVIPAEDDMPDTFDGRPHWMPQSGGSDRLWLDE